MHHRVAVLALAAVALSTSLPAQERDRETAVGWSIVVHGGAGVIEREQLDAEREAAYRDALARAVRTGGDLLAAGGSALEAVETVIRGLEDDPDFNAGRGAVFTSSGVNELDASVMRGSDLAAGAVAGVTNVRHPISLAVSVMRESPHVMLAGHGAETFAAEHGLELVDAAYFFTERRWQSMLRRVQRLGLPAPERPAGAPGPEPVEARLLDRLEREHAFGTVGVVAMDGGGEVVAGTSTGGTTGKRWGRIGDSPVIGAGTYAAGTCGVSATGTGEYFIRLSVAARICWSIREGALTPAEAARASADRVIRQDLGALGGDGGIVMLYRGEPVWSFNTPGMYRAALKAGGEPVVRIFADEG